MNIKISCMSIDCPERDNRSLCWNDPKSPVYKRVEEAREEALAKAVKYVEKNGANALIDNWKEL